MAGTRAQPPQQEAGEHAAESRPATNSASGAKRRRRRRRHASRDESDDDDDHHRDQDHVSLAALPGLPTPVDRLGEEQSATPPPLPAAPAEPHAPLLFLGKKPMSERRLVVGSLAWRQKMAKSSVLTSFKSQVTDCLHSLLFTLCVLGGVSACYVCACVASPVTKLRLNCESNCNSKH